MHKPNEITHYAVCNIRIDLREMGINVGNWVDSAQDMDYWEALVKVALNFWFHKPQGLLISMDLMQTFILRNLGT